MRYFIFLIATIFCLSSLLTIASAAEKFRVMVYSESFPPYSFIKGSSETGIIRDLFKAISHETGDSFDFVHVPFNRGQYQFENGKIDIEPMCNPRWRQRSSIQGSYSIPFTTSDEIVLFNADKYFPVQSPESLVGKTIGTVKGYHYPTFDPYFADGRITPYPMSDEHKLIQMLLAERLDQTIMNKDFAQYQIKSKNLKDRLAISNPLNIEDIMIRFHPSKKDSIPRFNEALRKLIDDGTIKRIYDQYR